MPLGHRHLVSSPRRLAPRSHRGHPRRGLIALIVICAPLLLAPSCGKPVEKVITLTFTNDRPDMVTISASTQLGEAEKSSPDEAVIDREREAIVNGSDEWAIRFQNADPEVERVTTQRTNRKVDRVEHAGVVPIANLQRFFFDTPLTINVVRGEGWNELNIQAGTSKRATRQERERVERLLSNFSEHAVRYFEAARAMYDYLDSNSERGEVMFYNLALSLEGDKNKEKQGPAPALNDTEQKLVESLSDAIAAMFDDQRGGAGNVDREFDAVFNPFPGDFRVVVPGEPLEVEGFDRQKEQGVLSVRSTDVLKAVAALEGKWLSPDPLSAMMAAGDSEDKNAELAAAMAKQPRHAADVVRTDEVRDAIVKAIKPVERYRVRWIVTASQDRKRPSS